MPQAGPDVARAPAAQGLLGTVPVHQEKPGGDGGAAACEASTPRPPARLPELPAGRISFSPRPLPVAGTSFEDGESLGLTVGGEPLHTRHLEPIGPGPGLSDVDVDGDALRGSSSLSFEVAADLLDTFSAEVPVVDLSSGLPVPVGSSSTQQLEAARPSPSHHDAAWAIGACASNFVPLQVGARQDPGPIHAEAGDQSGTFGWGMAVPVCQLPVPPCVPVPTCSESPPPNLKACNASAHATGSFPVLCHHQVAHPALGVATAGIGRDSDAAGEVGRRALADCDHTSRAGNGASGSGRQTLQPAPGYASGSQKLQHLLRPAWLPAASLSTVLDGNPRPTKLGHHDTVSEQRCLDRGLESADMATHPWLHRPNYRFGAQFLRHSGSLSGSGPPVGTGSLSFASVADVGGKRRSLPSSRLAREGLSSTSCGKLSSDLTSKGGGSSSRGAGVTVDCDTDSRAGSLPMGSLMLATAAPSTGPVSPKKVGTVNNASSLHVSSGAVPYACRCVRGHRLLFSRPPPAVIEPVNAPSASPPHLL